MLKFYCIFIYYKIKCFIYLSEDLLFDFNFLGTVYNKYLYLKSPFPKPRRLHVKKK